jgi:hypothetical protein
MLNPSAPAFIPSRDPMPQPKPGMCSHLYPHLVNKIYEFCDAQTQLSFRAVSRLWLERLDEERPDEWILKRKSVAGTLYVQQRRGAPGIPRGRQVTWGADYGPPTHPDPERAGYTPTGERVTFTIKTYIWEEEVAALAAIWGNRVHTLRIIGGRGWPRLAPDWSWIRALDVVVFPFSGLCGTAFKLYHGVRNITVHIDPYFPTPPVIEFDAPHATNRPWLTFVCLHHHPPVNSIDDFARYIASFPMRTAQPTCAHDLGNYIFVNFNYWAHDRFVTLVDRYRQPPFNTWEFIVNNHPANLLNGHAEVDDFRPNAISYRFFGFSLQVWSKMQSPLDWRLQMIES